MDKPCGNSRCSSSTGIHDGLTFGYGRLDHHGYWQFPCRACAKRYDEQLTERIERLKAYGLTDQELGSPEYLWVSDPAWPYETKASDDGILP